MVHLLLSVTSRQRLERGLRQSSEWLAPGAESRIEIRGRCAFVIAASLQDTRLPFQKDIIPNVFGLGWCGAAAASGLGAIRDFLGYGE